MRDKYNIKYIIYVVLFKSCPNKIYLKIIHQLYVLESQIIFSFQIKTGKCIINILLK